MTKISRKKVTREGEFINDFWRTVTFLSTKEEVRDFLKGLLTPTEMIMLAKRLEVAKLLMHDCPYLYIKREVQVTNATITHVKNCLVNGAYFGLLKPLKRLAAADKKIIDKRQARLEGRDLSRTTLSQELAKAAGAHVVKQYKKWQKFRTAQS